MPTNQSRLVSGDEGLVDWRIEIDQSRGAQAYRMVDGSTQYFQTEAPTADLTLMRLNRAEIEAVIVLINSMRRGGVALTATEVGQMTQEISTEVRNRFSGLDFE